MPKKVNELELVIKDPRVTDDMLPFTATDGSAGFDLPVLSPKTSPKKTVIIPPKSHLVLGTGIAIHIKDKNVVGLIFPKSGLGTRDHIILSNLVGVIDSDYQGEIKIPIHNDGDDEFYFDDGDKLFQMVFVNITRYTFKVVAEFDKKTKRGETGFGANTK